VALALAGRWRRLRPIALVGAVLAAGPARSDAAENDPQVVLGREVYIAEGCIHCHSQYVRPGVALDVERWGPATNLTEATAATPPLFGNRRQGPDLANVGNRRSLEWNRLHLISPRLVSPGSRMPSYAHLFAGPAERGEALLAYLASLGAGTLGARQAAIAAWKPSSAAVLPADDSRRLFQRLCAPCHGESGRGDGPLAARLSVRPVDWSQSEWRHVPAGVQSEILLGRIIKFGLPGLPMAGHEYLPDREIVGLVRHVQALHSGRPPVSMAAAQP
jgi:cytochrome c oxidase cbb3-type subunit 2